MRFLVVSEPTTSIAFYADFLGFREEAVRGDYGPLAVAELVHGAARLQLVAHEAGAETPPIILFFVTDDVAGMREAIRARGGSPSELENVNWIKMRMFEVRDPDGHVLWFGQSFQEPDDGVDSQPRAARQCRTIMPELPLDNVPAGVAYYREVLGFSVNYAQHDIGVMDRDDVRLLLIARSPSHAGIGSCYVYVRDADALHAELAAKGANVQGEPVSQPWGLRELHVLDPEGNRIGFGQTFE